MQTSVTLEIRPLREEDASAARALVLAAVQGTPYAERALEVLGDAAAGSSPESAALVALRGTDVVGVVVYGEYGGAVGAGRLHLIAVTAGARLQGIGGRLVDAAVAELARRGARFVLGEVPDDRREEPEREMLLRCGFAEEARIPDFYAEGVALSFLRRQIAE